MWPSLYVPPTREFVMSVTKEDKPTLIVREPIPPHRGTVASYHPHLHGLATSTHETSGIRINVVWLRRMETDQNWFHAVAQLVVTYHTCLLFHYIWNKLSHFMKFIIHKSRLIIRQQQRNKLIYLDKICSCFLAHFWLTLISVGFSN